MIVFCPSCKAGCVGPINRNIKIRICEHRGISYRTNRLFFHPRFSTIREHSLRSDHGHKGNYFKILYRARKNIEIRVAESLLIYKKQAKCKQY